MAKSNNSSTPQKLNSMIAELKKQVSHMEMKMSKLEERNKTLESKVEVLESGLHAAGKRSRQVEPILKALQCHRKKCI